MTNEIISLPLHQRTAKISNGKLAILTTTIIRETFVTKVFLLSDSPRTTKTKHEMFSTHIVKH